MSLLEKLELGRPKSEEEEEENAYLIFAKITRGAEGKKTSLLHLSYYTLFFVMLLPQASSFLSFFECLSEAFLRAAAAPVSHIFSIFLSCAHFKIREIAFSRGLPFFPTLPRNSKGKREVVDTGGKLFRHR